MTAVSRPANMKNRPGIKTTSSPIGWGGTVLLPMHSARPVVTRGANATLPGGRVFAERQSANTRDDAFRGQSSRSSAAMRCPGQGNRPAVKQVSGFMRSSSLVIHMSRLASQHKGSACQIQRRFPVLVCSSQRRSRRVGRGSSEERPRRGQTGSAESFRHAVSRSAMST